MVEYATLKHWPFGVVRQSYTARDVMLYALGCGLGSDPLIPGQQLIVPIAG